MGGARRVGILNRQLREALGRHMSTDTAPSKRQVISAGDARREGRPLPVLSVAPGLATRPFLPLATITSVEPLPGFDGRVFVKRDDRVSPLYGGNKVRRWEWLLAEAISLGKTAVMTVGGTGSTQVTSVSAHAQAAGLSVSAVLFDQPETAFVDEALALDRGFGAHLVRGGGYARTALETLRTYRARERPYFIAPGASGPLANLAYVDAMLELGAQIDAGAMPRPDKIVVACGSGGTTAGLAVGAAILGYETEVIGVRITDLLVSNRLTLAGLARGTVRLLRREGLRAGPLRPRMHQDHRFIGQGYGFSTPEAERGAARYQELFGVPGEVTYSGKAMAALETIVRESSGQTILLWNTLSSTGRA